VKRPPPGPGDTRLSLWCGKILESSWLAAAVTIPLFFNCYSARTFEPDKALLLCALAQIMCLAWVVRAAERVSLPVAFSWQGVRSRVSPLIRGPLVLPVLCLAAIQVVSSFLSVSPTESLWGSYTRMQGLFVLLSYVLVFFVLAAFLEDETQVERLLLAVITASVPVSLYGLLQQAGLDPVTWKRETATRVEANLGNAILLGSYLLLVIPLTLGRWLRSVRGLTGPGGRTWRALLSCGLLFLALCLQLGSFLATRSRGPLVGLMVSGLFFGLLWLLLLRAAGPDRSPLRPRELGGGILCGAGIGLITLALGAVGGLLGAAAHGLAGSAGAAAAPPLAVPLALAAAAAAFLGCYGVLGRWKTTHRWLWVSWLSTGAGSVALVLLLNSAWLKQGPAREAVDRTPLLNTASRILEVNETASVRLLIWDAVLSLILAREPVGIPGDDLAPPDRLRPLRPIIGYGPDTLYTTFPSVYPSELVYTEPSRRGIANDRSHNESLDQWVTTGALGLLCFYVLLAAMVLRALRLLGLASAGSHGRLFAVLAGLGGAAGLLASVMLDTTAPRTSFCFLGLPFGAVAGLLVYLVLRGGGRQPSQDAEPVRFSRAVLVVALLSALLGQFAELQFGIASVSTRLYFWMFAGILAALSRRPAPAGEPRGEDARGLADRRDPWRWFLPALAVGVLSFAFVSPFAEFGVDGGNTATVLLLLLVTGLFGVLVQERSGGGNGAAGNRGPGAPGGQPAPWSTRAPLLLLLAYLGFHALQLARIQDATNRHEGLVLASAMSTLLVAFFLFLAAMILVVSFPQARPASRAAPLPPFCRKNRAAFSLAALGAFSWWIAAHDLRPARAGIYFGMGNIFLGVDPVGTARALHERAAYLDPREDFYLAALAQDALQQAETSRNSGADARGLLDESEAHVRRAIALNPYEKSHYELLASILLSRSGGTDPEELRRAFAAARKARALAPRNMASYYRLGHIASLMREPRQALSILKQATDIDDRYPDVWILLGDVYLSEGQGEEALRAHRRAIGLFRRDEDGLRLFLDRGLDARVGAYQKQGRLQELIRALQLEAQMQEKRLERAATARDTKRQAQRHAAVLGAVGHVYRRAGEPARALPYLERAHALRSTAAVRQDLMEACIAQGLLERAAETANDALREDPEDVRARRVLAYVLARQGNLAEAIRQNHRVLASRPGDYSALKNLALLYQQAGDTAEALSFAEQASRQAPDDARESWRSLIRSLEGPAGK